MFSTVKRTNYLFLVSLLMVLVFASVEWKYRYKLYTDQIAMQFNSLTTNIAWKSSRFEDSVRLLQHSAEALYSSVESVTLATYLRETKGKVNGFDTESLNKKDSLYGMLTYVGAAPSALKTKEMEMSLRMTSMFETIKQDNAEIPWVYYTSSDFIYIYPFVSTKDFFFDAKDVIDDKEFYRLGTPSLNPRRSIFWTKPYVDSAGEGLMVTLAAPVYSENLFLGTVAMDYKFSVFSDFLKSLNIKNGSFSLLSSNFELLSEKDFKTKEYVIKKDELIPAILNAYEKDLIKEQTHAGIFVQDGYLYFISSVKPLGVNIFYKLPWAFALFETMLELKFSFIVAGIVLIIFFLIRIYRSSEEKHLKVVEDSNRLAALGEMCGGIAHEINSPLTIIKGNLSLAIRTIKQEPLTKATEIVLDRLQKSDITVDRISDIVQGLRFFSKDYDTTRHEDFVLDEVLEMTYPLLSGRLKKSNITLSTQLEARGMMIRGVRVEISQVLLNLVNNAIDALEDFPGGEHWIKFTIARSSSSDVRILVQDSGKGIEDSLIPSIFRPFFSTKSRSRKDRFGLGLSICKGIVEAHNGTITYAKPNGVSTFEMVFPVVVQSTTASAS